MRNSFYKILLCSLLVVSSAISAYEEDCFDCEQEVDCCFSRPLVEFKAGYLFFTDSDVRRVYGNGAFDIQLGATYPIWSLGCGWTLNAYGAVEYFQQSGKSSGDQKTSIWSIPVNIGIKPVYAINDSLQYYFAIGPRYFYFHQHNDSSYVFRNKSKSGWGLFVNTGFNYIFCDHFVIDLFGEYSYAKVHFHGKDSIYTRNIQIGGFTVGGGLGYQF